MIDYIYTFSSLRLSYMHWIVCLLMKLLTMKRCSLVKTRKNCRVRTLHKLF